ncbi:MAG: hypothetical protein HY043_17825 [Verrucomicrobia bacterium]|nr:hypothetical protein [Verrucomicrobiota bacterium]
MKPQAQGNSVLRHRLTLLALPFLASWLTLAAHGQVTVGFESTSVSVSETNQQVTLNVLRSGDANVAFTVDYLTIGREATPGADFVPQSGTLQFAAGETNQVITVPILDNGLVEPDKLFFVALQNPTAGVTTNLTALAWITIQDNEKPLIFDPTFNQTVSADGIISALVAQPDGKLLLFGNFTNVNGIARSRVARLNADGSIDISFVVQEQLGNLYDREIPFVLLPDGKLVLAQSNYDELADTNLHVAVRLNQDGSVDHDFISPVGLGAVGGIARQGDGKIVILTSLWKANTRLDRIVRIEVDGKLDASFNPDLGVRPFVDSIAIQSSDRLLVGGQFQIGTSVRNVAIIQFNTDGTLDKDFISPPIAGSKGVSAEVYSMLVMPNDKILVGGRYSDSMNGTTRSPFRLYANGLFDPTFRAPDSEFYLDNARLSFASAEKILIASPVYFRNGERSVQLFRANSDGTLDSTFLPGVRIYELVHGSIISSAAMPDGGVVVAESTYAQSRAPEGRLFRFAVDSVNVRNIGFSVTNLFFNENSTNAFITVERRGNSGDAISVDYEFDGGTAVSGLDYLPQKGTLTFAPFEVIKRVPIPLLDDQLGDGYKTLQVRLTNPSDGVLLGADKTATIGISDDDSSGSIDVNFVPQFDRPPGVRQFLVQPDGKCLVLAQYAADEGTTYIARLNPDGSQDESFHRILQADLYAIQPDGKILSWMFNGIARYQPDGTSDESFKFVPRFDEHALAAFAQADGKIVFQSIYYGSDHLTHTAIGRLNSDGSSDPSLFFDQNDEGRISLWTVQLDGKLLVAGISLDLAGENFTGLLRLNVDGSRDATFAPIFGEKNIPSALTLQPDGKILIATYHALNTNTYYGISVIERLDIDGRKDPSFTTAEVSGNSIGYWRVSSLAVQPDKQILVGGDFTQVNGVARNEIARLNEDGSIDPTFDLDKGVPPCPICFRTLYRLELLPDGRIMASGWFTQFSDTARPLVRLNNHIQLKFIGSERKSDGCLKLRLSSPPGISGVLDASSDLKTWTPVRTNAAAGLYLEFQEQPASSPEPRFYRVRELSR